MKRRPGQAASRLARLVTVVTLLLTVAASADPPPIDPSTPESASTVDAVQVHRAIRNDSPARSFVSARQLIGDAPLTQITVHATGGGGGVAQTGPPAAIFRSTPCGFLNWIPGMPAWLDQLQFSDNAAAISPLRSYSTFACFGVCHLGCGADQCQAGTCTLQGDTCDCLTAEDLPITVDLQLYDGDPCGSGLPIAGTQGSIVLTETEIPPETIGSGDFQCFDLTVVTDPKVLVPQEVWIEAQLGHDDAWVFSGRPNNIEGQGTSPLSGLDDGVNCTTHCDVGGIECTNDQERCDWMIAEADSNAQILFSVVPVPPPAGSKPAATSTYQIVGDEAILTKPGEPVWLEIRVTDFDPKGTGALLQSWSTGIDSSGYKSGLRGSLTPFIGDDPCFEPADCVNLGLANRCRVPDECSDLFPGIEFTCDDCEALGFPCRCTAADSDRDRVDHIFFGLDANSLGVIDTKTLNALYGGFLFDDPIAAGRLPDYLLGSLVLFVQPNAKGTFTIAPREATGSALLHPDGTLLPLVGVTPAKITVQTGACCDFSSTEPVCLDDELTANECAGLGAPVVFNPGQDCSNGCVAVCGDGLVNQSIEACDGTDDAACPGLCRGDCSCPVCGDGVLDAATEECDGNDAQACPGPCQEDCTCAPVSAVPAASTWAVAIMALALLAGARICFRRRATM